MKRTLLLMRHAKSDWNDASLSDYDRPLNARGRKSAPRMGDWLLENGLRPDVILSSTAKRASQTTELVLAAINYHDSVTWLDKLYHASPQTMLDAVATVDSRAQCVLLVAHNPGMEELVSVLGKNFAAMPTAAIAHFELTSDDWSFDPDDNTIRLIEIAKPKEL